MYSVNLPILLIIFGWIFSIQATNSTTEIQKKAAEEDQDIINETISKYGPPEDIIKLGLPGPELLADKNKYLLNNQFLESDGNYTIRIRTIFGSISYNGRYENGTIEKVYGEEIPKVKGQFAEHFERKSGGYYIRTIGYTLDENGYRQFLIDLSKATVKIRTRISSTVLASLVGGNSLG